MTKRQLFFFCICSFILSAVQPRAIRSQEDSGFQFNRDIRPILSDKCYACHGPDENQRQADLRLDLEEHAKEDLGGYAAIVPGDAADSELITRIFSSDKNEVMPPADHRKSLTEAEKDLIRRWIDGGAKWQSHWAWIAPHNSTLPKNKNGTWAHNFVDHFILEKLEARNLQPSPEADRTTLIRRLYFDLLGLPPTPDQVDAFLADTSDDAYEKLVDELLESPHFGERLAIYWLDLVRYADTVGYHGDQDISVSPYRDYVIESFNSNKRFDQFTLEQLAGDLLESPTDEQLIASGYNRLGMMSAEGGVQPEEYLTKYAADRVRTTASVWLGITLGCAECHDHKFDPLTIKDFYSFASFFADIKERGLYSGANSSGDWGPQIDVPDEELPNLVKPFDDELEKLKAEIIAPPDVLAQEQADWETELRNKVIEWNQLKPLQFEAYSKTPHELLDDDSVLLVGERSDEDCYSIVVELTKGIHHGLRLEVLPDETLPQKGPGRANNGNFVVTQLLVIRGDVAERLEETKQVVDLWNDDLLQLRLQLNNASATIEQNATGNHPYKKWSAASAIDKDKHGPTFGWAILPDAGKVNELVVCFAEPLDVETTQKITIVLQQYHGAGGHVLGRFRFSTTTDSNPAADPLRTLPPEIRAVVEVDSANRSVEQSKTIADHFFSIAPRFKSIRQQISDLETNRADVVQQHTRTSLITEAVEPREIRVLPRGNWMDLSGEVVFPNVPELLGDLSASEKNRLNRLDLAHWIVDSDNPLTARTFVNRLWMLYFGTGLSKVLDDLGSQGEPPTHPELLDALAIQFVESDWDVKQIIRTLVSSQTYRQSSLKRSDLDAIDPYNRLLARQIRFRLDAELIRDNALAVSGLLIDELGGRSVKPYQPPGLYRHLNFPTRTYQADEGQNQFRRGIYTHWQRQFLHPAMKAFDAPAREECTCQRPRSNTPIGALVLLNDPSYVEAARKLAENVMRDDGADIENKIEMMFRRALSRKPNERELAVLSGLYESHLKHYQAATSEAKELVSTGISPVPDDLPVEQLAAWTSVARTIMNMHEFVTRN